jgi:hypothetical protein
MHAKVLVNWIHSALNHSLIMIFAEATRSVAATLDDGRTFFAEESIQSSVSSR